MAVAIAETNQHNPSEVVNRSLAAGLIDDAYAEELRKYDGRLFVDVTRGLAETLEKLTIADQCLDRAVTLKFVDATTLQFPPNERIRIGMKLEPDVIKCEEAERLLRRLEGRQLVSSAELDEYLNYSPYQKINLATYLRDEKFKKQLESN